MKTTQPYFFAKIRVMVSCRDSSGTPTFYSTTVTVTNEEYHNGDHYDVAKDEAINARYENVGIAYDEYDLPKLFEIFD